MKIDITKKYIQRDGTPIHLLTVTGKDPNYPVVGELENGKLRKWTQEGFLLMNHESHLWDLIEDYPYRDFQIDDLVMVSDFGNTWTKRHFAGINKYGKPMTFSNGTSSWTTCSQNVAWNYCRKPTFGELNKR